MPEKTLLAQLDVDVRAAAALRTKTEAFMRHSMGDPADSVRCATVQNPHVTKDILMLALEDKDIDVQIEALHALARLRGYTCEITREDDGTIGVSFPDHKGLSITLLAYSLQNLAKTMEESIDLHQNSPFLNCRWDSVHGKVKQVELFCLPTLGEGSELYQITYESGTLMRTPAKEMVNFMKKQAYEITPEGQAEKQAKEDAYHQRVAKAEAERAAAQERLAALTGKIEGWLDTGNYTPRQRGLAIKVLSEQCQFRGEVTTRAEFVAKVIEEGHAPATHTESRIRDKSNLQWFRMTAQQQREHEKKMASGGEKTVYRLEKDFGDGTCTSFTVTKTEYEYACFLSRQPDPAPVATKQKAKSASFSM